MTDAINFLMDEGFGISDHGMTLDECDYFIGENHYNSLDTNEELEVFKTMVIDHKVAVEKKSAETKEFEKITKTVANKENGDLGEGARSIFSEPRSRCIQDNRRSCIGAACLRCCDNGKRSFSGPSA